MQQTVVIFSGKAGVGKDTAADFLCKTYGFKKTSFADSLKKACSEIFGYPNEWNYDQEMKVKELEAWPGWSPRKLLQFVGTDLFRNRFDPAVWVKSACLRIRNSPGQKLWVLPDGRFQNEIDLVKELLPDARVCSFQILREVEATAGIPQHASENQEMKTDGTLRNDGTPEDMQDILRYICEKELGDLSPVVEKEGWVNQPDFLGLEIGPQLFIPHDDEPACTDDCRL